MKKRNIFSRQAVNFLWVLLGLGAGLQFIEVIWAASKGYLGILFYDGGYCDRDGYDRKHLCDYL